MTASVPAAGRKDRRERNSYIFDRDEHDHYVEPFWNGDRLFDEADFDEGPILDPACGWGRLLSAAHQNGHRCLGSDVVDRDAGWEWEGKTREIEFRKLDFLALQPERIYQWWMSASAIVCNPPFDQIEDFAKRALSLMDGSHTLRKVAFVCPLRRLPAAHGWLEKSPLSRVMLMTPRPSMPTGKHIDAGGKVGGGTQDFVFLLWEKGHVGARTFEWLHRDAGSPK